MNKTHSTNIGGTIFDVEDDAYQQLRAYLDSVAAHFRSYPDVKDIVADIESRIAEHLVIKNGSRRIVTQDDVSHVVAAMGSVEQFGEAPTEEPSGTSAAGTNDGAPSAGPLGSPLGAISGTTPVAPVSGIARRRLYRDPDERVIAGVASGVAAYADISPAWIRILFLGSLFLGGFGFIVYVIMWLCVPLAKTMTDKMRMRGDPVTLATIEQEVRSPSATGSTMGDAARLILRIAVVCVAALALVCVGWCAGYDVSGSGNTWRWELKNGTIRTYHYSTVKPMVKRIDTVITVRSGTPRLDLSTISGDICVTTWSRPQVKIVARTTPNVDLDFNVSGNDIRVRRKLKPGTCVRCGEAYNIVVPAGTSIRTRTVSGDQRIASTGGTVRITSISGDVEVVSAKEAAVESVSGDLLFTLPDTVRLGMNAESISGRIRSAFGTRAAYDLRSDPGQKWMRTIDNTGTDTHIQAKTVSGDIRIRKAT